MVTLTYRRDKYSAIEAHRRLSRDVDRFIKSVRKKYGKIGTVWVPEIQQDGFPHVHICILFYELEQAFDVQSWKFENGTFGYVCSDAVYDDLEGRWCDSDLEQNGFITVRGMSSVKGGFNYSKKYLTKAIRFEPEGSNIQNRSVRTLACSWLLRRRGYNFSHQWATAVNLIDQLFGPNIMMIGTITMPVIEQARKRLNQPLVWTNFEYPLQ
jgi:hypothetical protein